MVQTSMIVVAIVLGSLVTHGESVKAKEVRTTLGHVKKEKALRTSAAEAKNAGAAEAEAVRNELQMERDSAQRQADLADKKAREAQDRSMVLEKDSQAAVKQQRHRRDGGNLEPSTVVDQTHQPTNILMVGNPGAGKSTILNGIAGKVLFESGVNFGEGMTFKLEEKKIGDDLVLLDTPGLDDPRLRDEAAKAITLALKKPGQYKLFFVVVIESGRIRPGDLATMQVVTKAAQSQLKKDSYGIIINKLDSYVMEKLEAPHRRNPDITGFEHLVGMMFKNMAVTTSHVYLAPMDNSLTSRDNVVWTGERMMNLKSFISAMPSVKINAKKINDVDPRNFEQLVQEIAKLREEMTSLRQEHAKELAEAIKRANGWHFSVGWGLLSWRGTWHERE